MSNYVERMEVELKELEEKVEKLEAFIKTETFEALDEFKQGLLKAQKAAMDIYVSVLKNRILVEKK